MMIGDGWIEDIRRRIQESLNEAKRDKLRDQYGMIDEYHSPNLPPEVEGEWLDYILEFERQFENSQSITVRERIGNPPIPSFDELPPGQVSPAIDALLELLEAHGIAVDFLGQVTEYEAYQYVTETVLNEKIDDIRIPGMWMHFDYATREYEVEFWVGEFVSEVFSHELMGKYLLLGLERNPILHGSGKPITAAELEAIWQRMPPNVKDAGIQISDMLVLDNEAHVTGLLCCPSLPEIEVQAIRPKFRLEPSPYLEEAWEVVETTLITDLLRVYGGAGSAGVQTAS